VFQLHHLLPHLTVVENVMLPLIGGTKRGQCARAARRVLDRLGLSHRSETLASKLSGGERQLTSVARAVVNEPRLILADEPTGSVDSATGARILESLYDWSRDRGGTLVMVTHDQQVAARADRIIQLHDGHVVVSGP
jgi:ABC-type lipoprotein export system ATPase subunit